MTSDDVQKMDAGDSMDTLIAEKVMGMVPCEKWTSTRIGWIKGACGHASCHPAGFTAHYSRNIAAAWEVVEFMQGRGNDVSIWVWDDAEIAVTIENSDDGPQYRATAPTAPLAICRTALLATEAS